MSAARSHSIIRFLLAGLLAFAAFLSASGQSSNGYTYYRIAAPGMLDSTGTAMTGSPNGSRNYKTDGTNILFSNYNGGEDYPYVYCSSDRVLYKAPVTGGPAVPLITASSKVEPSQPAGAAVSPCSSIALFNGSAFYGAVYTSGSTTRTGYFQVPIAGGTSQDFVASGDVNAAGTVGVVYNGQSFTQSGNLNTYPLAIGNFPGSEVQTEFLTTGNYPNTLTQNTSGATALQGLPAAVSCTGYTLYGASVGSQFTDGNGLYAGYTVLQPTGKTTAHAVIVANNSPTSNSCSSLIFDPAPNGVNTLMPGEPAQYGTGTLNAASISNPTVYQNTVYFSALRYEQDGTYFSVIYSVTNGVLSTFLSDRNVNTGVVPTYATICDGTTVYPFLQLPIIAGKYMVFYGSGETQNCTTQAYTNTGGFLFYDLVAKTFGNAAAANTVFAPGDPALFANGSAVYGQSAGSLAADGHFVFSIIPSFDAAGYPASTILYSVYLAQQVTAVSLSASPAATAYAGAVTLTSKVTPNTVAANLNNPAATAGGTVTFYDGTTLLGTGTIDATGTATFTTNGLLAGSHALTAVYGSDPNFQGSTSATVTVPVAKATTTTGLTVSAASAPLGASITLTGTLTTQQGGTPTGSLVFFDEAAILATVPLTAMNNATYTTTALPGGAHSIAVAYAGDANFLSSQSGTSSVVVTLPSTTTVTPSAASVMYGQAFVYKVGVTGTGPTPTGTIAYTVDGGAAQTATLSQGAATITLSSLTAGSHKFTYIYSGDTYYTAVTASGSATATVTPAPLSVVVNSATRTYGSANPTFTGMFAGLVAGDTITPVYASTATTLSAVGTYPITATLTDPNSRLGNYTVTNTPATLTVTKASDTLGLSVPATAGVGSSVMLTATAVSGTSGFPTGLVTFSAGTTVLGTGTLSASGVATFSTSALALGTYSITASYSGDGNFTGSVSGASGLIVGTPDFSIVASPASATLNAGQSATFSFVVTPVFGYSQTISLACSGLPANSTCTFVPATITPAGSPVTSTLTIATNVKSAALEAPRGSGLGTAVLAAMLLLVPFSRRARRLSPRLYVLVFGLVLGAGMLGMSGCGSTACRAEDAGWDVQRDGDGGGWDGSSHGDGCGDDQ